MAGSNSHMLLMPDGRNRKKLMENWTTQDTMLLIQVWKEHINELRKSKQNQHIYQQIAEELLQLGIRRSSQEVKNKISNLTAEYRIELQQLRLLRKILAEQRRANAAALQSERQMRRDLHDQMALHRRSLQLEERMTRNPCAGRWVANLVTWSPKAGPAGRATAAVCSSTDRHCDTATTDIA